MKTHTLLVLGFATALVLASSGCKTPPPRISKLPDPALAGHGTSAAPKPEDGAALTGLDKSAISSVTGSELGSNLSNTGLADDDKLRDRDMDRSEFAQQTVYFEYDRSSVKTDEASKIDQVAADFKTKGADFDLLIEGHCDERGTEEYNRSLGERRALAIRELLIKSGVDAGHVFTRSFGKDQPATVGHDESAWSRNRRGEFILVLPKKIITTQNQQ